MWFKQIQIYALTSPIEWDDVRIEKQLGLLKFKPCLPHLFSSNGWIPPCNDKEEEPPLMHSIPGVHMVCCQFEEKILPATVIQQALQEKIKQMTENQGRKKISVQERQALKEAITQSLLPRAFTKFTKIYAYIDLKLQLFVVNTTNPKKTEQLVGLMQRSLEQKLLPLAHKKMAPILTRWLINNKCPRNFYIEKNCLLQDPQQKHRLIRCQEQDLFSKKLQPILQDQYQVVQLALSWNDQVHFVLSDDLTLRRLSFSDEMIAAAKEENCEMAAMQLQTDLVLMVGIFTSLITELMKAFGSVEKKTAASSTQEAPA